MRKVTVVGSGVMGTGIAYAFSISGYDVCVNDINEQALNKAKENIYALMDGSVKKGYLKEEVYQSAKNNLKFESDLKMAADGAELVIEAVLERMDVKVDVFKQLDEICGPDTVLATNTSTMSPTEIGAQTSRPDKVVAMHFFNPVHKMKLIEVIRGLETSDETMNYVHEVATKINKTTVEVNEFPGFVTSRMNCLIGNEAMNLLMEGVASAEDIDNAMKLGLNHPMGPLELADLVGLDTRLRNMEYLYETLGEKYRPCPLLVKYVKAGRLGKKSGRGFYEYS